VVLADEISMQQTERLKELVRNYPGWVKAPQIWVTQRGLRDRLGDRLVDRKARWMRLHDCDGIPLELSTRTYRIESERDLCGVLGYLVKPIDWSEKYVEEWRRFCAHDRDLGAWFNQNVDQVIECWQFWTSNRHQHIYLGTAHHARKGFIGIPKRQRETHRQKGRLLLMLQDLNEERLFKPDDLAEPLEFGGDVPGGESSPD
jgi:hypothetical protein